MNESTTTRAMRLAERFALLAGSVDLLTGILLVFLPAFTLRLMLIPEPVEPVVLLRFVGVFVGSVGASYLLALRVGRPHRRDQLAATFRITTLVRTAVGCFITWAVLSGALSWQWSSVALTDFSFAVVQLWLLRRI